MRIVNKKKFITSITILVLSIISILIFINLCRYPEKYITTWKYQLKQDIAQGNQEAIDYYQSVYLDNGQTLWD